MHIRTEINLEAANSMIRFLTSTKPESFTGDDTIKIAETVIGGIFPELAEQERAVINRIMEALMNYAALDGFAEGTKIAKRIAVHKHRTSGS